MYQLLEIVLTRSHVLLYCVFRILLLQLQSRFSRVRLFATPWTVAHQAPLSTGFSRQESGVPGNLPDPGIKSCILAGGFFTAEPPGKPVTSRLQTQFRTAQFLKGRTQGWGPRWARECGGKAAEGLVNILQGELHTPPAAKQGKRHRVKGQGKSGTESWKGEGTASS